MGKSTFLKQLPGQIFVVSSDEIRQQLIGEESLKNPKLSTDDLFKRTNQRANKLYDDKIAQYLRSYN